jgi:hypothetical protein
MDSINLGSILTFLSGGVIGGIIGGATKFFWEKYLPDRMTWRRQQQVEREKLLSQFRGPAIRAIHDLERRIWGTVEEQASGYERTKHEDQGEYYINATTFQIAQCCAWMEILREKMGALDYAELETRLDALSSALIGDYLPHFHVYLLQQREIGERMISLTNGEMCCKGYSEFLDLLNRKDTPACFAHLRGRVATMLNQWGSEVVKLIKIQHALVDAVEFLDQSGRWIINRPGKLKAAQVIEDLRAKEKINGGEADQLRRQALKDGLM